MNSLSNKLQINPPAGVFVTPHTVKKPLGKAMGSNLSDMFFRAMFSFFFSGKIIKLSQGFGVLCQLVRLFWCSKKIIFFPTCFPLQ